MYSITSAPIANEEGEATPEEEQRGVSSMYSITSATEANEEDELRGVSSKYSITSATEASEGEAALEDELRGVSSMCSTTIANEEGEAAQEGELRSLSSMYSITSADELRGVSSMYSISSPTEAKEEGEEAKANEEGEATLKDELLRIQWCDQLLAGVASLPDNCDINWKVLRRSLLLLVLLLPKPGGLARGLHFDPSPPGPTRCNEIL